MANNSEPRERGNDSQSTKQESNKSPEAGANRAGGQGNASEQPNVDADRDGASRQTGTASEESGQL